MRKVKKLTALLLVMAMVLTSFVGCGKSNNNSKDASGDNTKETSKDDTKKDDTKKDEVQTVSLKVWGPQEDQNKLPGYDEGILKGLCNKFNEAHPEYNITFEYGVIAEGDALKNLKKDPAAGADVFLYTSDQVPQLVEAGILNPLAPTAEEAMKKDIDEAAIKSVKSGDKVYGVPYTANTWFMYYNKSMYSADEVKSLDTMLKKDFGKGKYNLAMDVNNGWYNAAFFFTNGCQLFGAEGQDAKKCDFNNEKGIEVGNYMLDMYKTGKVFDIDKNNELKSFKDGKIAAVFSGSWNATAYKKALGKKYAACGLPSINIGGSDKPLSNFNSYKVVGVNSQTKAPKAALDLAEYLGGSEAQQARLEAQSIVPISKTVVANGGKKMDPVVAAINDTIKNSTLQPGISQMGNFWDPTGAFGAGIIDGSITKDNMKTKLDAMVKNILSTLKK